LMNKILALCLHLLNRCLYGLCVRQLKLNACRWFRHMSGPFLLPKAGLGSHFQRPYAEVIGPSKLVHEQIVVLPLQRQAQCFLVQRCTCGRLLCDHSKARNTFDFHMTSCSPDEALMFELSRVRGRRPWSRRTSWTTA